jgi:hypothetical protein
VAKDQLQEFFHEKKLKLQAPNVDWAAKRDQWIVAINALFDLIENDYLHGAQSDVEVSRSNEVIAENQVGEYEVPQLTLRVGNETVAFVPKGINVVGAQGRIDVVGDRGNVTMIWQGGDRWDFVASRVPRLQLVPVSPDSLAGVLHTIMRP